MIDKISTSVVRLMSPAIALRTTFTALYLVGAFALQGPARYVFTAFALAAGWALLRVERSHRRLVDGLRESGKNVESEAKRQAGVLANLSHEIRTPLNGIIGMAELLAADRNVEGESREHIEMLRRSAHALLAILNDVLDLAKIDAGKLELHVHEFSLHTLVKDTVGVFAPGAAGKDLLVETVLDPNTDWVRGDATRIRQVLSNFLSNAIKFTDAGGIVVIAKVEAMGPTAQALLQVRDNGCGMSQAVAAKLFTPFTQADASTASRHGGTGLGLAICKRLVEMMGGTLGVDTAPGHGSTFWFRVPVQVAEVCSFQPRQLDDVKVLAGVRILVAEDTLVNQRVIERTLSKLGCDVEIVGDGAAAVAALSRRPFDLVLMDCHMPTMDGLEATKAIRALAGSVAGVPIVALTASGDERDRQLCLEAGMNDYVPKPFRTEELVEVVRRCAVLPDGGGVTEARPR